MRLSLRSIVGWAAAIAVVGFWKFSLPHLTKGLPGCTDSMVRTLVDRMARDAVEKAGQTAANVSVGHIEHVSEQDEMIRCRGELLVGSERQIAVIYEISWEDKWISRYRVQMRGERE